MPNKIKLPKYSSYLTEGDSEILESFCVQKDCSKAKALSLLLSFWHNNKENVSNELATISSGVLNEKKYDERLANVEQKLASLNYDEQLAIIEQRLATLESDSKLIPFDKTITDNELATISNELATLESIDIDNELASVSNELAIKEDITESNTLLESPIVPLNEDLGVNLPNKEITETDNEKPEIGSLSEAIDRVIVPEMAKKTPKSEIAKLLQGKYRASVKGTSTNWQGSIVDRAIKHREKGKA